VSTATSPPAGGGGAPRLIRGLRWGARDVEQNEWGERAARFGIGARGVVFVVLGYLVARIALGALGQGDGTSTSVSGPGVADAIAKQPGGRAVLVVLGVGLVLFALFSLLEALVGATGERSDVKRWLARIHSLWQGAVYAAFAVYCFHTAAASPSSSGNSAHSSRQQSEWTAQVLRWPAGPFWLGLLGVALFALAAYQVWQAVRRDFMDDLEQGRMTRRGRRITEVLGVIGHLGRGATFGLVGWFVLHAAFEDDPKKGKGVDGSVRMLANSSGGPYLLWLIAIGLGVFGLYLFAEARYRKV
jgi:hypothetical protein